ncbi:MAG: hypothetical protein JXL84_13660 [Deltaproteobacteria bacterium]|nr:hypothetical protein [Deltaproteobacteria bacterium]
MRTFIKMLVAFLAISALVAVGALPALAQEKTVRAKIGILVKSGDQILKAKAKDRIKAGDMVRIYVHPEVSSYVYVVHSDLKRVTLLNMVEQRIQSSTLVLPSVQEFYQVDGKSAMETFTVICSPNEVKAVSALVSAQMTGDRWDSLQRELAKKGEMELAEKSERPFAIAGNVRGAGDAAGADAFVKELQIFSGKSVLVKQYEFRVKK